MRGANENYAQHHRVGTSLEVCFAEMFLRNPPVRILALEDLASRFIATVEVRRGGRICFGAEVWW